MLTAQEVCVKTAYEIETLRYRQSLVRNALEDGLERADALVKVSEADSDHSELPYIIYKEWVHNLIKYAKTAPNAEAVIKLETVGKPMIQKYLDDLHAEEDVMYNFRAEFYDNQRELAFADNMAAACYMMEYFKSRRCDTICGALGIYLHEIRYEIAAGTPEDLDKYLNEHKERYEFAYKVWRNLQSKMVLLDSDIRMLFYTECHMRDLPQMENELTFYRQKNERLKKRVEMMKKGEEAVLRYISENPEDYYVNIKEEL